MKKTLFFILLLTIYISLNAIGAFNLYNGRNRADLKWREVNTDNVRIIYSTGLQDMALHSAAIADSTYLALCKTFYMRERHPKDKVIIYISDQDDITNGATLGHDYIFIWVDVNDYLTSFTGDHKWLRKVIAHEMVHWFISYTIKEHTSFIPIMFPRSLNEGYAQFFSGEPWGLNRGDKFLRAFAFTSDVTEHDGHFEGGYLYASGFSLTKYLAEFYGEEKLIELLINGEISFFNFNKRFQKIFGKTFDEVQTEWATFIRTYYYGEAYLQKLLQDDKNSNELSINAITKLKSADMSISELVIKNNTVLASAKLSENQGYQSLILGTFDPDSLSVDKFHLTSYKTIHEAYSFTDFDVSPNEQYVVFARYTRHKHGRYAPAVFLYNHKTGHTQNLGEGSFPVVDDYGNVYYQQNSLSQNEIFIKPLSAEPIPFLTLNPENQIGSLKLNQQGDRLAVSIFDQDRLFKLAIFDTETQEAADYVQLETMPQELLWVDDQHLAITLENSTSYKLEVLIYDTTTKEYIVYDTPPYNIHPRNIVKDGDRLSTISLNETNRSLKQLGKVNLYEKKPEIATNPLITEPNYYTSWMYKEPIHKIPADIEPYTTLPDKDYNSLKNIKFRYGIALPLAEGAFGMAVLSEPLGKHLIAGATYVPYDFSKNNPYAVFHYMNKSFTPSIHATALHTDWFSGIRDNTLIQNSLTMYGVDFDIPYDFSNWQFTSLYYGGGFTYYDFELGENKEDYSYMFENSDLLTANLGVTFIYNKPWRNSLFHPVRKWKLDLGYDFSQKILGMKRDYQQFKASASFAYAPLLNVKTAEILKTLAIQNKTDYAKIGKQALKQHLPGIDDTESITISDQPLFTRKFLRGFKETDIGYEIISTQNDLRIKLLDDVDASVNWGGPLLSISYLGASVWFDYTRLSPVHTFDDLYEPIKLKYREYKAMGVEMQIQTNFLLVPMLLKTGQAYEPDRKSKNLQTYIIVEIPLTGF